MIEGRESSCSAGADIGDQVYLLLDVVNVLGYLLDRSGDIVP